MSTKEIRNFYSGKMATLHWNDLQWIPFPWELPESPQVKPILPKGMSSTCLLYLIVSIKKPWLCSCHITINTLRPRRNGQLFADDIFKRIFMNENTWISIEISLKFVPKGPINDIPAVVQIMAWRRPGDKPLSEPMMDSSPTNICVTRPQWVNTDQGKPWFIQG